MGEVASAYVSLVPEARGFGPKLSSEIDGPVSSAGDAAGQKSGSRFKAGFLSALGGLAKTLGAVSVGAIGAAGVIGVKTAAQMEQANIGFTTMLGSGGKARAFLGDLSKFAAATPFEFPELQTAASSLISVGIGADKVIPIMTSLGNATSGMGTGSEGIQRATVALQQMNAAGKITGEDLNQLRDAGIPVYDLLAAATGKSKAAVTDLAAQGKLGKKELDQLMTALETGKGLERFNGLMEKQSASLTGMWSTLKDTFSMGMAEAIQPLIPLLKDGMGGATTFLAANIPKLAAGLKSVVTQVTAWFAAQSGGKGIDLGAMFDKAQAAAAKLWPQVKSAAAEMQGIGPIVDVAGAAFGFLASHLDTLVKYMPLIATGFVAVKTAQALGNVTAVAALPIQAAQVLSNFALAAALRSAGSAATGSAAQQLASGGAIQASGLKTSIMAAAASTRVVGGWVLMGAQSVLHAAVSAGAWVAASARTVASMAAQGVAMVASRAAMVAVAVGTGIWTAAQWLLNAAMTANPIGIVVVAIGLLVAGIVWVATKTTWFQTIWGAAWGKVQGPVTAVWTWIRTNWPLLLAILTGPIGLAVLAIVKNWDTIKAGVVAMKDAVVGKFGELVGFVAGIPGRILSALGDPGAMLYEKGRSVITGLINGLKSMIPNVGGVMGDVMGKIAAFLPGSPVKEGPLRVLNNGRAGGQIVNMLAGGIDSQRAALEASMTSLVSVPRGGGTLDFATPAARASAVGGGTGDAGLLAEVQGLRADIRALPRDYQMGQRQYVGAK